MAWNPSPKIADLRDLARKWNVGQLVVLEVYELSGKFGVLSYGRTPQLCDKAKFAADQVFEMVNDGMIQVQP